MPCRDTPPARSGHAIGAFRARHRRVPGTPSACSGHAIGVPLLQRLGYQRRRHAVAHGRRVDAGRQHPADAPRLHLFAVVVGAQV